VPDPAPSGDRTVERGVAVGALAAYDAVARAYDGQFRNELDAKPLDRGLLAAFVELAGTGTIADVGCGPGHVTRLLAQRHPDVIGVDISRAMIAVAREHAPELAFEVGSMLDLGVSWVTAPKRRAMLRLTAVRGGVGVDGCA